MKIPVVRIIPKTCKEKMERRKTKNCPLENCADCPYMNFDCEYKILIAWKEVTKNGKK